MEGSPLLSQQNQPLKCPKLAEKGRNAPQSIKYSWVIPWFVNNVKGWITALVMQQSINWLSSVPLSEKQICTDLRPSHMLPCDRLVVPACPGG